MEILTYKKVYQLVGDNTSGTNECITKSDAVQIAESHRKNVTSNLSQYLNNEYIDVFAVEDKPDLSAFSFANNRYNPQAAGNTYTTAVSSRDIDGNTIEYNATADVDWITDIIINGTEIRFNVAANMGDQRTGHITGSNSTGKSDTITIIQEAKEADLEYTYSLVTTCTSVPTVTINGTSITRYTTSSNTYTFQYTIRVRTESEAPASVYFTINGGGAGDTYNEGTLSISPTSWDLDSGLSKQFTVGYSRVKTTKIWDHSTGTIARDGSTNVSLNATTATEYPTIDYTIRDTHPSGQSFSHSKNGMKFTSAASSTSCTGSITVAYGNLSATANVFYTEPVYDSYTYTVKASDTNTSGIPTITINGQNATVTHSDGYYIGKITISDSATTSAPDSVSWSISGGTKNTEWGSYNVSLSPDSWNLDDSLTNEFNVALIQSGTRYDWSTTSGTVAKNREVSTDVTSSPTSYTGSEYSVSGPSGMTFSKNGTSFTATASSTGNTGTITVTCTESDANGESATCNVIYNPALKNWTYTVNATCSERPTITIDGEDATITGEINAWVGTRIIVAQEDPGEKDYYVTSGSSSRTWTNVHVSVEPSSITITEKPKDISFTAYAYQEYEEYSAYTASGTTSNKSAACKPTRDVSYGTSDSETCDISASNVSGLSGSMSISKDGTTVSGTASDSGYVTVSYSYNGYNDSATCNITYEEQEETFPDWTSDMYVFGWGVRSSEDVKKTEISCKFDPYTGTSDDIEWPYYSVVSYRSRTGSKGTVQKEPVEYTGTNATGPSPVYNITGETISDSGELVQNGSGKKAKWSWSQDAAHYIVENDLYWSLDKSNWNKNNDQILILEWNSNEYGESVGKNVYFKFESNYYSLQSDGFTPDQLFHTNNYQGEYVNMYHIDNSFGYKLSNNSDNCVTIYPKEANSSYTDDKSGEFAVNTIHDTSNRWTLQTSLIQYRNGVDSLILDAVMFKFDWDKGKDLDCATYINDNVIGHEDSYAGWSGTAPNNNNGYNSEDYLFFAGDNTGTGSEYTLIDFKQLTKYFMQHRDDPSTISGKTLMESICVEGAPKITVDIYNNWYHAKEQEDIRITPYAAFYTGDSISIDSNNKEFVIDGLNMQGSPIARDAICYSTGVELHRDFKNTYTQTFKFEYYIGSGKIIMSSNAGDVSKWNKGVEQSEITENISAPQCTLSASKSSDGDCTVSATIGSLVQELPSDVQLSAYLSFATESSTLPNGIESNVSISGNYENVSPGQTISLTKKSSEISSHLVDNKFIPYIHFKTPVHSMSSGSLHIINFMSAEQWDKSKAVTI